MYERMLLATDGSPAAENAVEYGFAVAAKFAADVDLVNVVDPEIWGIDDVDEPADVEGAADEDVEDAARRMLEQLGEDLDDVAVTRHVRRGTPYREILDHAANRDVDLLVVGSTGRAESRLGSTSTRVVAGASAPVLVVPKDYRTRADPALEAVDDVVVALDGSDTADRAGEHALELAGRFGATVHALYVVNSAVYELQDSPRSIVGMLKEGGEETVQEYAESAEAVDVSSTANLVDGRPADEILRRAEEVDADLVAVGTRGRDRASENLLGSTTRRVIREATRPVLSVS